MSTVPPRIVVVYRTTEYKALLLRHATHAQAKFFLETRGQDIEVARHRHEKQEEALHAVENSIPLSWRRAKVNRDELDRFAFEPQDTIVIVGQDGLVANTAKYLNAQPIIGLNPDPAMYDGVLVPFPPDACADLLERAVEHKARIQRRAMVTATLDDGQSLTALNELFIGVQSHQSARYRIQYRDKEERQSSSGVVVTTGTGATGWARSINRQRTKQLELPKPGEAKLAFFVREAFPSVATGTNICQGIVDNRNKLDLTSENNTGGVIFGDGIEADFLNFDWGQKVNVDIAKQRTHMVIG